MLVYETTGAGFPLVLLHPFPVHHGFWTPIRDQLAARYKLILPDLRAHGRSEVGTGTATMAKHAEDIREVLDAEHVARAVFVGVSIGGYILFEFWRCYRDRVAALVLSNTRAEADTQQGRANRAKSIADARLHGTAPFFDAQISHLIGETTRRNRPDIVAQARAMMQSMTVESLAAIQQGMAERPDSVPTLREISVDTLIIAGEEDTLTPLAHAKVMHQHIPGSKLVIIPKAGHYAAMEQPAEFSRALRRVLDGLMLENS